MVGALDFKMWWREEKIFPNGDGTYAGIWANSADCLFTGLYVSISENPDDADTSYAASDDIGVGGPTCGHALGPGKYSSTMGNPAAIGASDQILSLTVHAVVRKTASSSCTFRSGIHLSGSESFGSAGNVGTGYVDLNSGRFTSKPGGGAWDLSGVNATEGIIETVTVGTGPQEVRCTQTYITVEYLVITSANLNLALSGNGLTGNLGLLSPSRALAITSNPGTFSAGNLAPTLAAALTGLTGTGNLGALSLADALALGGLSASGLPGTLVASGGAGISLPSQITRIAINRSRGITLIKGG